MSGAPAAVVVSGHMVDRPDRPTARFPADEVERIAAVIDAALGDWGVAPGTTIVTGGARGADILGAEAGLRLGAAVHLCLAVPPAEFEERSVALPGTDWGVRFRALLDRAEVEVVSPDGGADDVVFARANERMAEVARGITPAPYLLVVWDRERGDGPGGTADLVKTLGVDPGGERLRIIDPTTG